MPGTLKYAHCESGDYRSPNAGVNNTSPMPSLPQQIPQVHGISTLAHGLGLGFDLIRANPAVVPGDLFETGDLEPLPGLDGLDEVAGFKQA